SPIEVKRDPKERQRGSNRKWVLTTWTWNLDLDLDLDPNLDPDLDLDLDPNLDPDLNPDLDLDLDLSPLRVTAQWSLNLLMG
ncbi:hypothetical protein KUCAC02_035554, partial [Chaenocephalus aceratus]